MLPKNLQYQNKIGSASCRSYTSCIQPQNGTGPYTEGTTIIINIPTSPNTVLVPSESYFKFNIGGIVNGASAGAFLRLDKAGAHGVIQRLRTTHGSQELENFDQYYVMVGELMALQQSTDSLCGKMNILTGTANASIPGPLVNGASNGEYNTSTVGERLVPYATTSAGAFGAGATAPSRTYCLSLVSMVGSLGGQNYIPLFEMTSAPLTLNIQLVNSALKFLCSASALASNGFTISNVEFVGSFIELSDSSINVIRESLMGEPLQYVVQSYANYTTTYNLPNSTTSVSLPVSAKYASLRSLFAIMRSADNGGTAYFSQSSTHFNISEWRIRIGSQLVPYKAPSTMAEHFAELLKAIGSLSDLNHEPTINWLNYATDSVPTVNGETNLLIASSTRSNAFALGFDCEAYSGASKESLFAGMNTLNSDIFWNLTFGANSGSPTVRFDFYALYDNVLICENGVMRSIR